VNPSIVVYMNNFDFFIGTWDVANRRLAKRLVDCDDWEEFPGTSTCVKVWDGAANFDQIVFPTKGYSGLTVRLHDRARDEWSLYWASSRDGLLGLPPVVGRFGEDGIGRFYADEVQEGRPVRVRYLWDNITATTARWAQAFSVDNGDTWETNWVMDFTRTS
jgi:hypothetical protein